MRRVMTMKPIYEGRNKAGMKDVAEGAFHGWGIDYEEFEAGPANYTIAIVEMSDGSVQRILPESVRFLDSPPNPVNTTGATSQLQRNPR